MTTREAVTRRPLSLALRITASTAFATMLVLVVYAWQISRSLDQHFALQDLGELRAMSQSLSRALIPSPGADGADAAQGADPATEQQVVRRLSTAVMGHHGVYFSVTTAGGKAVYGTAPAELVALASGHPAAPGLALDALNIWSGSQQTWRGAVLLIGSERVVVAINMDFHLGYLRQLRIGLWAGTLVACALAIAAAAFAVRWGLAPVRRLSARIGEIDSEALHLRLDPSPTPAELQPLVKSFNAMLERLQQSFVRLSDFSADIAHELRTPVTNLTTQTQVMLSKPRGADDYRELAYSSLEELDRMTRMIGDMLFLAQADHARRLPALDPVDLAHEVRMLFDYFEALAEDRGVTMTLEGECAPVPGDPLMLRRAAGNLISNGLRHTPRGQCLTVRLRASGTSIDLIVENPGPEIAAEHLPRLFDRFYRVDPARRYQADKGDGTGLGLAIAQSVIQAHGGRVSAHSGNGLTRFTISLPALQQPVTT
ncbi:MAG: heavy metal sensor histidine kinase [Rubrivivax sp.]